VFGDPLYDLARYGLRVGLSAPEVAELAAVVCPGAPVEPLPAYRSVNLLAQVSLGAGQPMGDFLHTQCVRALAELASAR
jgi:hypothetical protein